MNDTGHLVITRKSGESFHVGDDVEITVHSCRRGTARIGITAPKSVKILRNELQDHAAIITLRA